MPRQTRQQSRQEARRRQNQPEKPTTSSLIQRYIRNPWLWSIPAIAIALVLVIVFTGHHGVAGVGDIGKPVASDVMNNLTTVPASVFDAAGTKGATAPVNVAGSSTPPTTSSPVLLYMGSEFCPFCAAERWVLVTALSRFGTWHNLTTSLSSTSTSEVYPGTPTFSFQGATFDSPYVTVQTVEMQGRTLDANGQYPVVETPTTAQGNAIQKYDNPPYVSQQNAGAIPFVLLNNQYLWSGASYSPQLLQGGTWSSISKSVASGSADPGTSILANANMVSAAICATNGGQPASVCNSAGVQAAAKILHG